MASLTEVIFSCIQTLSFAPETALKAKMTAAPLRRQAPCRPRHVPRGAWRKVLVLAVAMVVMAGLADAALVKCPAPGLLNDMMCAPQLKTYCGWHQGAGLWTHFTSLCAACKAGAAPIFSLAHGAGACPPQVAAPAAGAAPGGAP